MCGGVAGGGGGGNIPKFCLLKLYPECIALSIRTVGPEQIVYPESSLSTHFIRFMFVGCTCICENECFYQTAHPG